MMDRKIWEKAEILIFCLITIVNLLPFVSLKFLPTLDGASHLSNANIINQILFYHNDLFRQFFQLNPEPVPNWTSHFVLALFQLFLPAFIAEKILIVGLLIGLPFLFRRLMRTIAPQNYLYSYLIFPFTHSMFFFFGFFNFCIAVLFFLATLNYWLHTENRPLHARKMVVLFLLVALTYFSHILVFGTLLIVIVLRIIARTTADYLCKKADVNTILKNFLRSVLSLTLVSLIPLILFIYFFYSRPSTQNITYIVREELIKYLVNLHPLISLNPILESQHTRLFFYLLVILIGLGIISFLARLVVSLFHKTESPENSPRAPMSPSLHSLWLLGSLTVLFTLFLFMPDAYGDASYTNLRLEFIFLLLTILLISSFRIPWWIGIGAALVGLYVNILQINFYNPNIRNLEKIAVECNKAADYIAPNSMVLPVYCMENWFTGHFVDYLAIDKPILMVYNYECATGFFPVVWNKEKRPNYYIGNPMNKEKYIDFTLNKGHPSKKLRYVFILGNYDPKKDGFFITLHKILTEDFIQLYKTDICSLYQDKRP